MRADSSPDKMSDKADYRLLTQLTNPQFQLQETMPRRAAVQPAGLLGGTLL